jgi:hypothetical protein
MDSDDDDIAVALQLKISREESDEGPNAPKESSTDKVKGTKEDEDLPAGVYEVESIIDHSGDLKRKASVKFRVRWKGFEEEDDTWEPFWAVKKLSALKRYLDSKNPKLVKMRKQKRNKDSETKILKKPKKKLGEDVNDKKASRQSGVAKTTA